MINIEPFWLHSNLCHEKQSEWWFNAYNVLFNRDALSVQTEPLSIENIDETPKIHLDSQRLNETAKVLELIRLKSGLIKLVTNHQEKFKLNLKICIKMAKYLQQLVDSFKSTTDPCIQVSPASEPEFSPKEKLDYIEEITFHYWKYVCNQIVKSKQLSTLSESLSSDLANLSVTTTTDEELFNRSIMSNLSPNTSTSTRHSTYQITQFYFEHYESISTDRLSLTSKDTDIDKTYDFCDENIDETKNDTRLDDAVLRMGVLNIILKLLDGELALAKTRECLNWFEMMENNIKIEIVSENNAQLCKHILEVLYEKRNEVEKLIESSERDEIGLKEKHEELSVLIRMLKDKIDGYYINKRPSPKTKIVEKIVKEKVEPFKETELDVTIETKAEDTDVEAHEETPKAQQEISVTQEESLKAQEETPKVQEDVSVTKDETPKAQEETSKITKEPETGKTNEIKEAAAEDRQNEKESIVVETSVQLPKEEVIKTIIIIPVEEIIPEKQAPLSSPQKTQTEIEQDRVNLEQSNKILGLIETLNIQRMAHLMFNRDLLAKQYHSLKQQQYSIKQEINLLDESIIRKKVMPRYSLCNKLIFRLYV